MGLDPAVSVWAVRVVEVDLGTHGSESLLSLGVVVNLIPEGAWGVLVSRIRLSPLILVTIHRVS